MKIVLVQPFYRSAFTFVPPLGLGYLASSLRNAGHDVQIVDCLLKKMPPKKFLELIKNIKPDVIGVSIFSVLFGEAKELILKIKECSPATVVIGGHHVTALPTDSLKATKADFALVGEGEETIVDLIDKVGNNQDYRDVKGICFRSAKGKFITTPPRPLIENIDNIPFPAWDLFDMPAYPPLPHGTFYRRSPSVSIITTRGCFYSCTFCAANLTFGKKVRRRSAKNVVDEIELLHNNYGIKEFHFADDNFTHSKAHAMGVAQEIIDRKCDIVWSCPNGVRIDLLDNKLLNKMRESGCYRLSVGIESFSQKILNKAKKRLDVSRIPERIQMIKDAGLEVEGFFIFGLPGETEDTIRHTIKKALELPLDLARFHAIIPLPGTHIYDEWFKGVNSPSNFSRMSVLSRNPYKNIDPSLPDVVKYQRLAHRRFYLRPKYLLKTLSGIKYKQLAWLIKRAFMLFS